MHPRFYDYYKDELAHLRDSAAEFAAEFPKIAGRLTLDGGVPCADPYVERLLEGFAFLAARVRLKLDVGFPALTQHLLEMTCPDYLAPLPAMALVEFEPQLGEGALKTGVTVARGTALRGRLSADEQTPCIYRTAHELTLWPLLISSARYQAYAPELPRELAIPSGVRGALRLSLTVPAEMNFAQLSLNRLVFHLAGDDSVATRLYEQLFASCAGVVLSAPRSGSKVATYLPASQLQAVGFSDDEALLPPSRTFRGYRLLREYAALPQRFLFFALDGLAPALANCDGQELELCILLKSVDPRLEALVSVQNFKLNVTPVINLFSKTLDRIQLDPTKTEYHLLADRTCPMDYEVFSVTSVMGYGGDLSRERRFRPLYASIDQSTQIGDAYYSLRREPRLLSSRQKRQGSRTGYVGTEIFVSVTDTLAAPFDQQLRQLSVEALCTNRDLPILSRGKNNRGDFSCDLSLPVTSIRCVGLVSKPVAPALEGDFCWQLVSHLSLNILALSDRSPEEGAVALRQLLTLYGINSESSLRKQLEGVMSVGVKPIVRRLPTRGPVTMGRGVEVRLECDEPHFEGFSPFVLASVLEVFFSRHASINAFTETVLAVVGRGELMRWKSRAGTRPVL